MKKIISLIFVGLVTVSTNVFAAGGHDMVLDKAHVNMSDKEALRNGAKLFMNYCLSCHSAGYSRYNRVAEDLEIPLEVMKENAMFTTEKEGDLMTAAIPAADAKRWFGVTPPDLTLVSRVRKPDWVYSYLRAFYKDDKSASGWNNSVFDHVAMPHVMYELQGVQRLVGKVDTHHADSHGSEHADEAETDETFNVVGDTQFEIVEAGSMTPKEFDKAMADLTAFLVYMAEPAQLKRKSIGVYTLGFLIILMLLSYLLNKEFWRDVH